MCSFRLLALVSLSLCVYGADTEELSNESRSRIERCVSGANLDDASKAYAAYLLALQKTEAKIIEDLRRIEGDGLKKGNIALVLAVREKVQEIRNGLIFDYILSQSELLGEARLNLRGIIEGEWTFKHGGEGWSREIEFNSNGTLTVSDGRAGRWKIDHRDRTLAIEFGKVQMTLSVIDKSTIHYVTSDGKEGTAVKGRVDSDMAHGNPNK